MSLQDMPRVADPGATIPRLSQDHHDGLIAVVVFSGISLIASTSLFLHLTQKLVRWHIADRRRRKALRHQQKRQVAPSPGVDLSLGLAPQHFQRRHRTVAVQDSEDSRDDGGARPANDPAIILAREPNQFVVLLYNLLLADIKQSVAFFLNIVWVIRGSIQVGTGTCWTQGFFLSTGDLAGSLFIAAIAVHTYLVAIKGWKPTQRMLIWACVAIWVFDYFLVFVGLAATGKLRDSTGFFVVATTWCWVSKNYEDIRLFTHYFWVFICLALTSVIYTWIFLHLRRLKNGQTNSRPGRKTSGATESEEPSISDANKDISSHAHGYNSTFLVYPIIYVVCTAPLAIGRISAMTGNLFSVSYFCAAGVLISCNGFLDALLWGMTRRDAVFGDIDSGNGSDGLGLESFSFMRTPHNRKYGNMIWIEAGGAGSNANGQNMPARGRGRSQSFWSSLMPGGNAHRSRSSRRDGRGPQRSVSQQSLRGAAALGRGETLGGIQMDLVTTVVVEIDPDCKTGGGGGGGQGTSSGLVVTPEDYIAATGSPPNSQGGTGAGSPRYSASGSEKELHMNMDILNRV